MTTIESCLPCMHIQNLLSKLVLDRFCSFVDHVPLDNPIEIGFDSSLAHNRLQQPSSALFQSVSSIFRIESCCKFEFRYLTLCLTISAHSQITHRWIIQLILDSIPHLLALDVCSLHHCSYNL